ncbi:MAG: YdcH family protein [Gammaproteobacteria bacterium]
MFEFEQDIVNTLLTEDGNFRRLYDKHHALKERVSHANAGEEPLDDLSLETLKKQKLMLKDQMAMMIEQYRRTHPMVSH